MKQINNFKYTFMTILFLIVSNSNYAQKNYKCFDKNYNNGIRQYKTQEFDSAYNSFKAAKFGCENIRINTDIDEWLIKSQDGLITLIKKEKSKSDSLLLIAEKQKENAINSNNKVKKINNAMYFYKGEFALAYKNGKYGFVHKQGKIKIKKSVMITDMKSKI